MSATPHLGERLADFVDGRMTPAEQAEVRAHVATCEVCRGELGRIEMGRALARQLERERALPPGLAATIGTALDGLDRDQLERRGQYRWLRLAAAAAIVTLAGTLAWFQPWAPTILEAAATHAERTDREGLPANAIRSVDARTIERHFAEQGGPGLGVRVIDLAMMGWQPEGGAIVTLPGRPSVLYAYRNAAGERLICQMFGGTTGELPSSPDIRSHRGFTFHVFRQGDVTLVFWQEGRLVCVLASRLPADAVVALAFEKAMAPG